MTSPKPDLSRLKIDRNQPPSEDGRRRWWIVAIVLVALLGAAYAYFRGSSAVPVQVVRAEVVGGGANAAGITANGYVVARTRASVSSRIAGRLAALGVEEGTRVRRGQVMARLENADYEAAVAQAVADSLRAMAALEEAQIARDQLGRDLARAKELLARNLESASAIETINAQLEGASARVSVQQAQVRSAQAALAFARANLDNTYIKAPFDGTVLRKDAEVGEVVAPVASGGGLTRGAVVTMADLSTLEVEVDVNEAYIAQIKSQQPARITLDAYPSVNFAGRVRQIVPTADRQRATVQVKVAITEHDSRILPEMGARVEFFDSTASDSTVPSRVFVPADAVRSDGPDTIVWVVREGVIRRTVVQAGPVSGGRREIRSGLSGGESLVNKPPAGLEDGGRVDVVTP
ncbi:MAG: efflux RND transporter periplasmic adaptor subunit [Gemmatimonadales bacterium]